jgi:hypothetical protein
MAGAICPSLDCISVATAAKDNSKNHSKNHSKKSLEERLRFLVRRCAPGQFFLGLMPEFVFAPGGLSGLLPEFVSANSDLLFRRFFHLLCFQDA